MTSHIGDPAVTAALERTLEHLSRHYSGLLHGLLVRSFLIFSSLLRFGMKVLCLKIGELLGDSFSETLLCNPLEAQRVDTLPTRKFEHRQIRIKSK